MNLGVYFCCVNVILKISRVKIKIHLMFTKFYWTTKKQTPIQSIFFVTITKTNLIFTNNIFLFSLHFKITDHLLQINKLEIEKDTCEVVLRWSHPTVDSHHWLHYWEKLMAQSRLVVWRNGLRGDRYSIYYKMYFTARRSLRILYLSECITYWTRWNNSAFFYVAYDNNRYGSFIIFA